MCNALLSYILNLKLCNVLFYLAKSYRMTLLVLAKTLVFSHKLLAVTITQDKPYMVYLVLDSYKDDSKV
jgi:hypothetical protein